MACRRVQVRSTLWIAASVALLVPPLAAQIVQGTVLDRGTTSPVRGAVVYGLGAGAGARVRVLADVEGHFSWRAPSAGTWTLEIRAIGFVPTQRAVTLGAGETARIAIPLERAALSLASVRVQERNSCRSRTELAADASTLWNDVWSALAGTLASRDLSRHAVRVTRYVRTRHSPSDVVDWEERTTSQGQAARPFRAVAAGELAKSGFRVTHDDGSTTFYAPDAETLIAPEFIARHCYGITRADTGARPLLGVAFWPHRGIESSDVEGVLWVDAQSRELRTVEFHYPALRDLENGSRFGGFASYARQPDGSWSIDAWQIRVPVVARSRRVIGVGNRRFGEDVQDSVVQVSEEGGFISTEGGGRLVGVVGGAVRDEAGRPESGANVELVGTTVAGMTDSLGAFQLTDVLPGRYLVRAYRGGLDTRASFLLESTIDVAAGGSVQWNPIAAERASIRAACPERGGRSRDAVVQVVLRDALTQRPLRFRPLQFVVSTVVASSVLRAQRHEETLERTSDWRGAIALCDITPLAELRVRQPAAATWSFPTRLRAMFTVLDVDVDAAAGLVTVFNAIDQVNALRPPEIRAPTRVSLVGRLVSDDSSVRPLSGVEVTVDVPSRSVRSNSAGVAVTPSVASRSARTNGAGVFVIDDLPLGIVVVRARYLGFIPVQRAVVLDEAAMSDTLTIRLSRTATMLAPVTVEAEAAITRIGMREFDKRRAAGFGVFLDASDFERSGARTIGSVIASSAAGLDLIKVMPKGFVGSGYAVASKRYQNLSGKKCYSQVILNGVRVYAPGAPSAEETPFVIDQIDPTEVVGLEIYRSAADTPLQFGGPSAACGTVVIWTK